MNPRTRRRNPAAKAAPELLLRAGSALVLAAFALALTYAGLWPFAVLVVLGGGILAWEWGQLVRGGSADPAFCIHAAAVAAAAVLTGALMLPAALAAVAAGGLGAALLSARPAQRPWSAIGPFYIGLPAAALIFLRSDPAYGLAAIVFLFMIVWSADTASYFFGRMIGGPKLAPQVSPSKTWSGAVAGLVVPALLGYGFGLWLADTRAVVLGVCGIVLALVSQFGDLTESAAKRHFHVKDAGGLVPGHGGLLDRVDGLLFAALAASLIAAARDGANPGKALLIWP